ncbi:hypothetical protein BH10PSE18_BH10PSE18_08130 [soil metagenome]
MSTTQLDPKTPLFTAHPAFDTQKAWVLLWSQKQGHLHIETLDEMLTSHRQAFAGDVELQYIPLLVGDQAVIEAAAEHIRPTVELRHNAKHGGADEPMPYDQLP